MKYLQLPGIFFLLENVTFLFPGILIFQSNLKLFCNKHIDPPKLVDRCPFIPIEHHVLMFALILAYGIEWL